MEWIPCTERLPEKSGRYLVTRKPNALSSLWARVYIVNYSDLMGLKKEKIWWSGNVGKSDFEKFNDVIAWQPLPEPYKTNTENEKVCNGCYYNDGEVHAECIVCDKQLISDTALEKMIATDYAHRLTMDKDRKGEKKMIVKRMSEYEVDCPEIGDRIDFTLKTGENIEAMAVQKLQNGTVFCAVDYLSDPYQMNYNGETKGGYEGSDLRKILNSKILDSFPDDIREQLIPFDNGDLITIPSEREMFGKNVFAARYEVGVEQWKTTENRHNRVAFRNGEYEFGWLRNTVATPYIINHVPTNFVCCSSLGNTSVYKASSYLGVRPVFIMRNLHRTEENKMVDRKTWEEYRNSGMLWFANVILHMFGWAIVFDTEHKDAYPARVRFRGFSEEINSNGYRKVSKYIADNANDLLSESEE